MEKKKLMKAAMNIEIALLKMPKKKKVLSAKEELFRNSLGVRLKTRDQD